MIKLPHFFGIELMMSVESFLILVFISGKVAYPELTFAAFLNCSKLEVEAFRSRLLEAVDSASDPESRSENSIRIVKLL